MSRILVATMAACLLGLLAAPARADEADLRKAFQARFPEATVESITRTPFTGLYEIVFDGQVVYADEKLNYMFFGNLYDMRGRTERNLTRDRTAQLTAESLSKATASAIKRVRGNGKRTIYTFEDPNCGYCKAFQKELAKVNDVTIYTFLWPILSPDSVDKSKAVWCAKDRVKAWDDVLMRGVVPQNDGKCETPLEKNKELAQRFGARGTPAVYLADGRQIGGMVPADKIEEALSSVPAK
ncbi:MAG TPA: DsbC family protein [Burkholderiales bacterium]|nr:DsbC family protein [Burkholderiales bacterium]